MARQITAVILLTGFTLLTRCALPASAQERPAPAIEFAAGALMFPDEGVVTEGMVGGTGRFYVSPRVSIGPEIAYMNGRDQSHLMLTGNVTFDLTAPGRRVTPFLVAGGGLFRTSESFSFNQTSTHNEGAFTAGGGVRALVGDHLIVGAELRAGWETHVRANGFIGLRLGK